jgi:hypothetical protein
MAEPEPDDVTAFIEQSGDPVRARLCAAYARTVNLLDPRFLEELLAEDVTYESQEVLEVLRGRATVADYIKGKLETVRQGGQGCLARAELAREPGGAPCVLVHQRNSACGRPGLGRPVGTVLLEPDRAGKAKTIFLATIAPTPGECTPTGIFPGLTAQEIARDRGYLGTQLDPAAASLVVILCASRDDSIVAKAEEAARYLGITSVYATTLGFGKARGAKANPERAQRLVQEACRRHEGGCPAVLVFDGDEVVRGITGYRTAESLYAELRDLYGKEDRTIPEAGHRYPFVHPEGHGPRDHGHIEPSSPLLRLISLGEDAVVQGDYPQAVRYFRKAARGYRALSQQHESRSKEQAAGLELRAEILDMFCTWFTDHGDPPVFPDDVNVHWNFAANFVFDHVFDDPAMSVNISYIYWAIRELGLQGRSLARDLGCLLADWLSGGRAFGGDYAMLARNAGCRIALAPIVERLIAAHSRAEKR